MLADISLAVAEALGWTVLGGCIVIAAASVFVMLTPTPRDDRWYGHLYAMIEMFALVVGRAKEQPPNRRTKLDKRGPGDDL